MKKQKKPWLSQNNQGIVGITALAALVAILVAIPQLSSMFGQKTEPKSPILSPKDSDTVPLKIRVTDTEGIPLEDVSVTVVSNKADPKFTNDKGLIEFSVSLKSTQVLVTLVKEGYETQRDRDIKIDPDKVEVFSLKKKK